MARILKSNCTCGAPVLIELGNFNARRDGKRPHFAGDPPDFTRSRCQRCGDWLPHSCPEAALA